MDIKVAITAIEKIKADAIIVNSFETEKSLEKDTATIDQALGGAISRLIEKGEIKGKLNETVIIYTLGKMPADKVAVAGLGKKAELTHNKVRGAVAETCRLLRNKGATTIATIPQGAGINGVTAASSAQAIAEGALLGLYTFRKHMTRAENKTGEIKELTIISDSGMKPSLEASAKRGIIIAEAANLARDMVNEPANFMTPTRMAEIAVKLAETHGLEVSVFDREQMAEMGMGALLGVAQGSRQPPKFIVLNYKGNSSAGIDIALIGKGITFDSGGISLKPSEKMEEMKGDMAGGASVMAAISAIAQLKARVNVMAIVPATENLPDGNAYKPGDVLKAMNGKTIEIISTDAEGRLILADALSYARKQGAKQMIDVATLTGACKVALGDVTTGAFPNNQALMDMVITASKESGEYIWQMPMFDEYREQNKSDVADIKNTGGRWGGAITAAKFLEEFVEGTPWVHLDIAGTDLAEKDRGYIVKGATGIPVRTLIALVLSMAQSEKRGGKK
jgi:leucyl aminopeptidase